jgi:hypothetical protein
MLRYSSLLALATTFIFALSSCYRCDKEDKTVYRGRIINSICGYTTIQFIDPIPAGRGENNWVDSSDGVKTVYNGVIKVGNPCNAGLDQAKPGDTISFRIVTITRQECAQCLAIGPTPTTTLPISVVR